VEDAAEAIVLAAEKYSQLDPINLGSGQEINIRDLVDLIKDLVGYEGEVVWDKTRPDGQPRRSLDTTRAVREFGWKARTPFRAGLQRTIEWFVENHDTARKVISTT